MSWSPGSLPHDFIIWLWYSLDSWSGWSTGGVLIFLVGLHNQFRAPFSKRHSIWISTVLLFIALFTSWRTEYLKATTGLKLEILGMSAANKRDGTPLLLPLIAVSNSGNPSTADRWRITITPVYGKEITAEPLIVDENNPVMVLTRDNRKVEYNQKQILYFKTASNPVVAGGKQIGLLPFGFPGMSERQLTERGNVAHISCADVFGNTISIDYVMQGGVYADALPYSPGMDQPLEMPTQ